MTPQPPRRHRRRRLAAWGFSLGAHLALLAAIVLAPPPPGLPPETPPVDVALVKLPLTVQAPAPIPPAPAPPVPAPPAPSKAAAPSPKKAAAPTKHAAAAPLKARSVAARADAETLAAADGDGQAPDVQPSASDMAGARHAGGGGGGGACDMAARLQAALRRDARVQGAVADADRQVGSAGTVIFLWNGDWIRRGGQDGAGLASVREAILWEVGFAPVACRTEPVHGLILLTLNDTPGAPRLALGSGNWRWSDLLRARGG